MCVVWVCRVRESVVCKNVVLHRRGLDKAAAHWYMSSVRVCVRVYGGTPLLVA